MGLFRSLIAPLKRAAFLFFRAQVELRVDRGVRLELNETPGQRRLTPEDHAAERARTETELIRRELAELLGAAPELREELRHLAYLETALQQMGQRALHQVPADVLKTALEQFEGLVSNWEPQGLALLRSRMAVMLRERQAAEAPPASRPAARVSEASSI
jgi:hypothetical protein